MNDAARAQSATGLSADAQALNRCCAAGYNRFLSNNAAVCRPPEKHSRGCAR